MSARWLLDIAALAQASRTVAQNHAALRAQQLTLYARTSSLAGQIRAQADDLKTSSGATDPRQSSSQFKQQSASPRAEAGRGPDGRTIKEEGPRQDHHYDASQSNSILDPKPDRSLPIHQVQGNRRPLSDGTLPPPAVSPAFEDDASNLEARRAQRHSESQIPAQVAKGPNPSGGKTDGEFLVNQDAGVFNDPSKLTAPTLSSIPRVKIPKEGGTAQEGIDNTNQDVFYSPTHEDSINPTSQPIKGPEKDEEAPEIDEAAYSQIFQTPRVKRMLHDKDSQEGGNPYRVTDRRKGHGQQWPPKDRFPASPEGADIEVEHLAQQISTMAAQEKSPQTAAAGDEMVPFQMRESRVPSSRFGRLWQYAGLGASMTMGAAAESLRRMTGSQSQPGSSIMLSSANMERLVAKLSRMRGAALKLGQMLSFQDSKLLPPTIHQVLQRVQDSADYMPGSQRNKVLEENLGPNWRDLFDSFEEQPMAAASIGQVHGAIIKSTGERAVVKIQYPGVANSISSDLNNLSILLNASRLLPKGLYLDKTIANARTELAWECDYVREANAAKKFQQFLVDETDTFLVPKIYDEACGPQVLTMQRMEGTAVTKCRNLTQEQKDWIGTQILRLCLREITEFKYMQTDPNWTNFLFNTATSKLELLDFGASREFLDQFIDAYTRILLAASRDDKEACRELSIELGYLTGLESKAMLDAHIASVTTLAEPFKDTSPDVYDFQDQTITDRVRTFIPVMLRERLAPPPEETYSLHRKLSGAFLLLAKLGARVRCKELFANAMRKFESS